ncbi:SDR family oxidoreductase [Pseudonocardia ailaonensis]|uniref:SDR family oxidoreductase n=1 Tax=Pseudonocardia ailaonensis TaxID=367279 RepID=UPI0031DDD070
MGEPTVPWDLKGLRVLVTGGGRGIGRVIATRFLAGGAEVAVCGRTEPEDLPEAAGTRAVFVSADLREAAEAADAVREAARLLGGLDVLVNNAGGSPSADAATASPRFFDRVVALNLHAAFYCAQAARPLMLEGGGGCVVNIGSISGKDPSPGTSAYSVAKAGLLMLTRSLALEWGPAIRINHVTVGQVATEDMAEWYAGEDGSGEAVLERLAATIPAGRMADPDDVASACLYLASPLAGYVSGADLDVTGGGEFPARHLATLPREPGAGAPR